MNRARRPTTSPEPTPTMTARPVRTTTPATISNKARRPDEARSTPADDHERVANDTIDKPRSDRRGAGGDVQLRPRLIAVVLCTVTLSVAQPKLVVGTVRSTAPGSSSRLVRGRRKRSWQRPVE